MKPKEILRWLAVIAFGGFGLHSLADCLRATLLSALENEWLEFLLMLSLIGPLAVAPLAISFFAFRRQYRALATVVAAVASLVVFGELMALPQQLHLFDWFDQAGKETPWLFPVALTFVFLCLFGPYYVTFRFFRVCLRLISRHIPDKHDRPLRIGNANSGQFTT